MQKIMLSKIGEHGKEIFWEASINRNSVIFRWGQIGGKIQENCKTYTKGKNIGRANETSPEEQCTFETFRKARHKIENGYIGDSHTKRLIDDYTNVEVIQSNLEVPKPTLANDGTKDVHKKKIMRQVALFAQPKIDGNRALVNIKTGKIYSRKRKEIKSLPTLGIEVMTACRSLKSYTDWVDGELYSDELTFNEIQSIVRKKFSKLTTKDIENACTVGIRIFDFISSDEQYVRTNKLENVFRETSFVKLVKSKIIIPADIKKTHDEYVDAGYEGLIIRFPHDGGYQHKRSNFMFKWKEFIDDEYVVVGFKHKKNKPNELGSIELEKIDSTPFDDGKYSFYATPKMSNDEKQEIWDNQTKYFGMLATVVFQRYDSKSGKPIFGRIKSFRDKNYN